MTCETSELILRSNILIAPQDFLVTSQFQNYTVVKHVGELEKKHVCNELIFHVRTKSVHLS